VIGNNVRVAQLLGADFPAKEPRVFFSEDESRVARSLLREANPAQLPVVVMVTQTSGGQPTNWHVERFAQVVRETVQRGCAVIYVGTAADVRAIETLRERAGGLGVSLAGRTTVSELAALLAASDFVVTLDTGTLHVGRSVGVPMVVLATPWQKTLDWMPLDSANVRILRGPDRAKVPADYKLDEISVESVIVALDELMSMYPSSAEERERRLRDGLSEVDHLVASHDVSYQT
jgi:ADP-heptose:LPS heptosyltransferase